MTRWVMGLWGMVGLALLVGYLSHFIKDAPPGVSFMVFQGRGAPLPNMVFEDAEGQPVSLSQWQGKVVLINVWATWCAPCVKEMPALDRLQSFFPKDRFEVIAIAVDRGGAATARAFFETHQIKNLTLYTDSTGGAVRAVKVRGLPTSVIVNGAGEEVGRHEGDAPWDQPRMRELIERLLQPPL